MEIEHNKEYLILGFGVTGKSIVRYLHKHNCFNIKIEVENEIIDDTYQDLITINKFDHKAWHKEQIIFKSPGISNRHSEIIKAKARGFVFYTDLDIFFSKVLAKTVLITGTNGKSTVCSMCEHLLSNASFKAKACGNIGEPCLDYVDDLSIDVFIVEMSSFQLESVNHLKSDVAVILNISEDHLDYHQSFDLYKLAKHRIFNNSSYQIANFFDKDSYSDNLENLDLVGNKITLKNKRIYFGKTMVLDLIDNLNLSINSINIMFSILICKYFISDINKITQNISAFKSLNHRCELVESNLDIIFINDSKSTNIESTFFALNNFKGFYTNIYLILGGEPKGQSFCELTDEIFSDTNILAFGQAKSLIQKRFKNSILFNDLDEIFLYLAKIVKAGDLVLFSPACASFDMYKNFQERGLYFKKLVKRFF